MSKKLFFLGLGLDSDGHKRVTTSEDFALVGGAKETHEYMTETAIKLQEKLKGKPQVSPREFTEALREVQERIGG